MGGSSCDEGHVIVGGSSCDEGHVIVGGSAAHVMKGM